jgi:hypothetical protein
MNNFDIWLSQLYIQPNIKYLIGKLNSYNCDINKIKCIYIFNLFLNKENIKKKYDIIVNINEIVRLIFLLITIKKIINNFDNNYILSSIYEILNIPKNNIHVISNKLCYKIINELLFDNIIFYNNLYIDIINNNKFYYQIWLSDYIDENILNYEEYKY